MRKFIIVLSIFTSTVLIIAYSVDYYISNGLKKTDLRVFQSWNDIYSSNINSDLIIVGSSRAWTQYSPQILDSILGITTYNIGIDGHVFDYQLLKYNTFRRFNTKPKYVILNIDFTCMNITNDGYEREQFFPYFDRL